MVNQFFYFFFALMCNTKLPPSNTRRIITQPIFINIFFWALFVFAYTSHAGGYKVLKTLAHDPSSFTQGLVVDGNHIIESSGLYKQSFIRTFDTNSGRQLNQVQLPKSIFAEGITLFGDQLYLLTWKAGTLYILDRTTFQPIKTLNYNGEGWGITHDHDSLITSNGSHLLAYRNPESFAVTKELSVSDAATGEPITRLNELEFAENRIWANQWKTKLIWSIDPVSGKAQSIDLSALVPYKLRNNLGKVLNGIAYDADTKAYWVTGKNWPVRYLLQFTLD